MPPHIVHMIWTIPAVGAASAFAFCAWRFVVLRSQPALAHVPGLFDRKSMDTRHLAHAHWRPFKDHSSGNAAFDEWRRAEIARLEEECRRIEATHREFIAFLDGLRRSKDREEFEHFRKGRH